MCVGWECGGYWRMGRARVIEGIPILHSFPENLTNGLVFPRLSEEILFLFLPLLRQNSRTTGKTQCQYLNKAIGSWEKGAIPAGVAGGNRARAHRREEQPHHQGLWGGHPAWDPDFWVGEENSTASTWTFAGEGPTKLYLSPLAPGCSVAPPLAWDLDHESGETRFYSYLLSSLMS